MCEINAAKPLKKHENDFFACYTLYRGERGELAPHVFLLTWLLPSYGDDIFMLHIYQSEYQELMAAKPALV